ncbi:thermonuclease family protein, partial [Haemophilus parainfluenzae]|uniref:thermonuclease family protein n=1 Tax=Haemophilus parainfluenzae TaxID=729 RepID=UPI00124B85F0
TRIYDGDTIEVFHAGQSFKARFACIDAPELHQAPFGAASKQYLSRLLPGQVRLKIVDQDRYGRQVAEVYTPDNRFVNQAMVAAGQAVLYP